MEEVEDLVVMLDKMVQMVVQEVEEVLIDLILNLHKQHQVELVTLQVHLQVKVIMEVVVVLQITIKMKLVVAVVDQEELVHLFLLQMVELMEVMVVLELHLQ